MTVPTYPSLDHATSTNRATVRYTVLDVARALAVTGVVFSHSVDGLLNAGITDKHDFLVAANEVLCLVRMPALGFTLGLFVFSGIAKRGRLGYFRARATFAVYAYLLWFFLQTSVEVLTSGYKNHATEPTALLQFWSPPAQMWFLPYLVVSSAVVAVLAPALKSRPALVLAVFALLSVVLWQWNPNFVGVRGLSLVTFTLAGAVVGQNRMGASLERRPTTWLALAVLAAGGYVALSPVGLVSGTAATWADLHRIGFNSTGAASLVASILGVVMLLGVSVLLARLPLACRPLSHIGQRTLEIYLAHVIVVAGLRIVLVRLGVDNQWVLIVVLVTLGVLVPLLLADWSRRLHSAWLFELPSPVRRWADRPKQTPAAI